MQKKLLITENQSEERLFSQQEVNIIIQKRLIRAKQQFKREVESKSIKNYEDDNDRLTCLCGDL